MVECRQMPSPTGRPLNSLKSLRLRWRLLLLTGAALLASAHALLLDTSQPDFARLWLLLASLVFGYQLFIVARDLPLNHTPGKKNILPAFGWGTNMSLVRLMAFSILAGFLVIPLPKGSLAWAPALLNLAANISDFLDGYLARITDHVTRLGQKLDMDLDGRGLLIVTLLAYQYGKVPWWFLSVGLARYAFLFGLWWRKRRGLPIHDLQPSNARRMFAGVQMGFATAMLVPAFSPPETTLAATLFMLPFLANFLTDWFQVIGQTILSQAISELGARLWRAASQWFAFGLRFALAILLISLMRQPPSPTFTVVEALAAAALALGAAGRVASAAALITLGFRLQYTALGLAESLLIIGLSAQLFLGTGPYSLWRPEDAWIARRAGERSE